MSWLVFRHQKQAGQIAARIGFSLAALFLSLLAVAAILARVADLPSQKVARGVRIGPIEVGGLSFEEARQRVAVRVESLEKFGLEIEGANGSVRLDSVLRASDPDQAVMLFGYNVEGSLAEAVAVGRRGQWWEQTWERLQSLLTGRRLPINYNLDENQALAFLKEKFPSQPMVNASFRVVEHNSSVSVQVAPEAPGLEYDYNQALNLLRRHLFILDASAIKLPAQRTEPQVTTMEAETLEPALANLAALGSLNLSVNGEKKFTTLAAVWLSWITTTRRDNRAVLTFDKTAVVNYAKAQLAPLVEIPFQEAKFVIEGSRVKEFQPSRVGEGIDYGALVAELERTVLDSGATTVTVPLVETAPSITTDQTNTLGIKELVGVGQSNFGGSPVNRRHNISVGANTLHGQLIASGETFSLLKALGPVDGEHNYLLELVIKGDKTTPEYGGGLCQIATTMFRAALAAGLPIVERESHAYRVSYYEPAGVDATIYDPAPDLKIINDTGHDLLIQSKIEGNNLSFELWGTKDGRQVGQTKPVLFNIKPPPPSQLIETLDLPVGQKKCTEKAHSGADAIFTYTVTYANGTIKKQDIKSHYRPWGEVCLIGVEKLSVPVDGAAASSTEAIPLAP